MASPGLATMSRSQFLDAWGITQTMKDALKQNKKTTRDIFEISSATTQCGNTIGACAPPPAVPQCNCYICGAPIYLTPQGKPWDAKLSKRYNDVGKKGDRKAWIKKNVRDGVIDKQILPQCEHILPVMQAFLILGGLYWAKTFGDLEPDQKEKLQRYEYAWSHAYCNNLKDDKNLFKDNEDQALGPSPTATQLLDKDALNKLLDRIWQSVPSIKAWVVANSPDVGGGEIKKKIAWKKKQIASITAKIEPLVQAYNEIMANRLLFFASVITPIYHLERLLPEHGLQIGKIMKITEPPVAPMPEGWQSRGLPSDFVPKLDFATRIDTLKQASGSLLGGEVLTTMFEQRQKEKMKYCIPWLISLFSLPPPEREARFKMSDEEIEKTLQNLYANLLPQESSDREMIKKFIMKDQADDSLFERQTYLTHLWQAIVLVNFLKKINDNKEAEEERQTALAVAGKKDECMDLKKQYIESKKALLVILLEYFENHGKKEGGIPMNTTLALLTTNWNKSHDADTEVAKSEDMRTVTELRKVVNAELGGAAQVVDGQEDPFADFRKGLRTVRSRWKMLANAVSVMGAFREALPEVEIKKYAEVIYSMQHRGASAADASAADASAADASAADASSSGERATKRVKIDQQAADDAEAEEGGEAAEEEDDVDVDEIQRVVRSVEQKLDKLTVTQRKGTKRVTEELQIYTWGSLLAAAQDAAEWVEEGGGARETTTAAEGGGAADPPPTGAEWGGSRRGKKTKKNHQRKKTRKKHRQKRTRKTNQTPKKKTVKIIHFYNNRNKQNKSKKK